MVANKSIYRMNQVFIETTDDGKNCFITFLTFALEVLVFATVWIILVQTSRPRG